MTSINNNNNRIKLTNRQEKKYEGIVLLEYTDVYKEAKAAIIDFIVRYGTDGKLSADAYKYDRYEALTKNVMSAAAKIQTTRPASVDSYLKDQYETNFLYTGFNLETQYQEKLGFKTIKRASIDPLSITGKVSLKNNATIVRANLSSAIQQSIANGEGIGNTSKRIKAALESNMNNALRISRTETTTALNEANLKGMEKAAKKLNLQKEWIATLDNRTRDRHRSMDGERVALDKKFSNGLMFPGDQSGSAAEVINCRCAMREILEGYESAATYRRARGVDGKNEVIPYKTYEEWANNRL